MTINLSHCEKDCFIRHLTYYCSHSLRASWPWKPLIKRCLFNPVLTKTVEQRAHSVYASCVLVAGLICWLSLLAFITTCTHSVLAWSCFTIEQLKAPMDMNVSILSAHDVLQLFCFGSHCEILMRFDCLFSSRRWTSAERIAVVKTIAGEEWRKL